MGSLSINLFLYLSKYENCMVVADFNTEVHYNKISNFGGTLDLASHIKRPTIYKNPQKKPSCIDPTWTYKAHFSKLLCY